ncbi:hypothetical protein GCM10009733_108610 [Nonomuraea maheshkhaliensis]|uniref:UspA domain-containing protein n=1 Tax=Nonomuraea maheshkhaliensis TaxID=419590 RepID=A0ABN2HXI9_9ACTN
MPARQLPAHDFVPGSAYDVDEIHAMRLQAVHDRLKAAGHDHPQVAVVEDVRRAHPVDALITAAERAGLLIVGSHGRGAPRSTLLGSVSRGVLHHALCPVPGGRGPFVRAGPSPTGRAAISSVSWKSFGRVTEEEA